jgi:CheY-like chemotaxis protein
MRILVVDDVGYVRHTLERLLSSHGHSVATADSGSAALGALRKDNGIEVVLTDLLMPGMDGVELFRQAQRLDRVGDVGPLPPLPFILMTALRPDANGPTREMALLNKAVNVEFLDVMFKPLDNAVLMRHFEKIANPDLVDEIVEETPAPKQPARTITQTTDLADRLALLETQLVELVELTGRSQAVQQRQAQRAALVATESAAS